MSRKSRRRSTRTSTSSRPRPNLFPPGYEEALAQLSKPGLELVFRRPPGAQSPRPPTVEEIQAAGQPTLDHFRKHIDALTSDLRGRLDQLPCLQVLSALVVATAIHDPETYRESESRYSVIHAEFAAWHYLTADPLPTMTADVLDSAAMQDVFDLLDEIAAATQSYYTISAQIAGASPETAAENVLLRARLWNLFVRSPSYEHHNRRQLEALFLPFAKELSALLGFGVDEALRVEASLTTLVSKRMNQQMSGMADVINEWHAALDADESERDVEELRLVGWFRKAPDPKQAALAAAMTWAQTHWYLAFLVTPEEIAAESELDRKVVQQVLRRFSTPFGQPRRADDLPSVEDRFEQAPLIDLGNDTWFVGLVSKLQWAIAPALEDALQGSPHWERYQRKHRSRYLEDQAVALIAGSDPRVERWTRLEYGQDDELDGLVLCGGTAILVETKAGRMSLPGRRGAPSGLTKDLRALLTDPQDQLNRATDYLLGSEEAVFRTSAGSATVRRADLNRLVHVIVTLDSLTAFVTRLPRLALAGVFDERSLPWAVDVNDLTVCTDILGSPARLVHYIDRRMRAARRGVEAPEELDFLGHYISRGLYFDKVDDGVDSILLTSHTEPIDDYYRHESGVRKTPASKPARATHPVIVALIDELEVTAPLNFAEAIFWLLELGTDGQTSMAEMIESRRQRARDGLITGVRSFFGRTIFVYLAVPSDDLRPLEPYVGAVKYLGRADRAVGICQSAVDRTKLAVSVRYEPWMEDAETARASEELLRNFETRPFKGKAPRVRRG